MERGFGYKVVRKGGIGSYQDWYHYSLPEKKNGKWIPGEWQEECGIPAMCDHGIHFCPKPLQLHNWHEYGRVVYLMEYEFTKVLHGNDKSVGCGRFRLVRKINCTPEQAQNAFWSGKFSASIDFRKQINPKPKK